MAVTYYDIVWRSRQIHEFTLLVTLLAALLCLASGGKVSTIRTARSQDLSCFLLIATHWWFALQKEDAHSGTLFLDAKKSAKLFRTSPFSIIAPFITLCFHAKSGLGVPNSWQICAFRVVAWRNSPWSFTMARWTRPWPNKNRFFLFFSKHPRPLLGLCAALLAARWHGDIEAVKRK